MSNIVKSTIKYILLIGSFFFFINQTNAQFTVIDDFRSNNLVDVVLGDDAKLTSGQEDLINAGWLRLTSNGTQQK